MKSLIVSMFVLASGILAIRLFTPVVNAREPGVATAAEWVPLLEDDFERDRAGEAWRVMRGDWRIEEGRMRVTRAWTSDNSIISTLSMPRGDMRAVIGIELESGSTMQLALRTGEHFWGGGGAPDFFAIHFRARPDTPAPFLDGGSVVIPPDEQFTVELVIEGGQGVVNVNGETIVARDVPAARSEVNRQFYLNCMPNGWVDFVRLYTRPDATRAIPIEANTPDENRRATVVADDFIDPENPAAGIQEAIDSLPPNGGVVILPEGNFMMRRHLKLRSGVFLRGQGWDQTTLEHVPIRETKVIEAEQEGDLIRVTVEDAEPYQVGDGMCFGRQWTHVVEHDAEAPNRDMVMTAIDGNVLTIRGYLPENHDTIKNFHPLIYAVLEEFVGVSDMTLRGPAEGPGGGGFNNNPVTFGNIYGARIHRLNIENFPADGVSVQRSADALVTGNTVRGTGNGFHPGTFTQRFLFARNLAVGNEAGLFYCFANENGVNVWNTVDRYTGYPFVGNNFNLINSNDLREQMEITGSGYAGLLFNNRIPELNTASANVEPGFPRYFSAPSYYVFAENRLDKLTFGRGTEAIVAIGNTSHEDALEATGVTDDILFVEEGLGLVEKLGLDRGAGRDAPVGPPARPAPILDGRDYYDPNRPDAGFQEALNELAVDGGTLQLPAGRYPLTVALDIPSNVTLAGYGVATVLYAGDEFRGSMLVSDGTENVTVRDVTILGRYSMELDQRAAAIDFLDFSNATLSGVDLRGWDGRGVNASGDHINILNSRAIMCAGTGFSVSGPSVIKTSLARECEHGIVVSGSQSGSRVEGNITMGNRGRGIALLSGGGALVKSNNSHFNRGAGIYARDFSEGNIIGNVTRANHQSGIALQSCRNVTVAYNHCSDDQIHPSQPTGIREIGDSAGNVIRGNLAAPFHQPHMRERIPAVIAEGEGTDVADNLIASAFPTGSSMEWYALGFEGTPHSHGRLRQQSVRELEAAEAALEEIGKEEGTDPAEIAEREAEVARARRRQEGFALRRRLRAARLEVMRLKYEDADEAAIAAAKQAADAAEQRLRAYDEEA